MKNEKREFSSVEIGELRNADVVFLSHGTREILYKRHFGDRKSFVNRYGSRSEDGENSRWEKSREDEKRAGEQEERERVK